MNLARERSGGNGMFRIHPITAGPRYRDTPYTMLFDMENEEGVFGPAIIGQRQEEWYRGG
ncbi:hypothetical protein [Paenibacillus sp.]|uniref:hypothetical protein n=1 Tax=Paenibacillus sp. TaxID=58172 RepID=UPI00282E9603|nr:hypothetical protein [Paenibacillus sp.]MDR0270357.1 hypothetical protein [Paenibacillus sp.]